MPVYSTAARSVGDLHILTALVKSSDGTAIDSTIKFIVNYPTTASDYSVSAGPTTADTTGSTSYAGITHTATGTWHHNVKCLEAGDITWHLTSTGFAVVSTGGRIAVRPKMAAT